jgi:hypothetical protein
MIGMSRVKRSSPVFAVLTSIVLASQGTAFAQADAQMPAAPAGEAAPGADAPPAAPPVEAAPPPQPPPHLHLRHHLRCR